jgi:hypothetical protein
MGTRQKPPVWFWIVAALLTLWGLIGLGGFVADRMMTPAMIAEMSDYDRQLRASQPTWTVWAYGLATATGLLGGIALLLRRRGAVTLFIVSLLSAVILFGYVLGATDIIAAKGFATAAGLPIAIGLIGVFEVWFGSLATRRGWVA